MTKKPERNSFPYPFTAYRTRNAVDIVVGGEETERNYFEKLAEEINTPERRVDVKVVPCGKDPLRVVQQAVKLKNDEVPDETWVVFDKDDFGDKFDNAIRETETAEMKVAPSNECIVPFSRLRPFPPPSAVRGTAGH